VGKNNNTTKMCSKRHTGKNTATYTGLHTKTHTASVANRNKEDFRYRKSLKPLKAGAGSLDQRSRAEKEENQMFSMNRNREQNKAMNQEQENKQGGNVSMKRKGKLMFSAFAVVVLLFNVAVPVFAEGDPIGVVNNLSDFVFGLIRAVGIILLGWGIVQIGLSFQSHDPSQRSNGFLTMAGGLVITFAREILNLIMG